MSENEKAYNEALDKAKEGNYASITDGDLETVTGGYAAATTKPRPKATCPYCGKSYKSNSDLSTHLSHCPKK